MPLFSEPITAICREFHLDFPTIRCIHLDTYPCIKQLRASILKNHPKGTVFVTGQHPKIKDWLIDP